MVVVEAEQAFFNFFFFFLSLGFSAFGTSTGASVVSSSLCSVGITGLVFFSFFFSVAFTEVFGCVWLEILAITLPRSASMFCQNQISKLVKGAQKKEKVHEGKIYLLVSDRQINSFLSRFLRRLLSNRTAYSLRILQKEKKGGLLNASSTNGCKGK
jgi:hypothetical protein